MRSPLPARATDGAWERYGIHGHALESEEFTKARAEIARRVRAFAEPATVTELTAPARTR